MARRTLADYKSIVLHALGAPDEADLDVSPGDIVNDAIEHIAAMHEWRWLQSGEQALDLTKDQDYVELPADFGTLTAVEHDEAFISRMIPTTWDHLLLLRREQIEAFSHGFWYVVLTGHVDPAAPGDGLAAPRLALYPTPASDQSGAIRIVYRRFLRRLENDADTPQIPAYMDRPLTLLARAFAAADYDDNASSAYEAQFQRLIADCMDKDGLSRMSYGVLHNGAASGGPRRISPYYPENGIPDPVQA